MIRCSEGCKIAYHRPCWKEERKKAGKVESCLTPDCKGVVVKVVEEE